MDFLQLLCTREAWIERTKSVSDPASAPQVLLRKSVVGVTKKIDREARTIDMVLSSGAVDRDGDTVDPAGWDISDYLKNPVVPFAHTYDELPVAKSIHTAVEGNQLMFRPQFPTKDVHPFGDTVYEMLCGGYLNAASAGFMPKKWAFNEDRAGGVDFSEQHLLEGSIVPVPSNPEALARAKAKGIDIAPLEAWAVRVLDELGGEPGTWLPRKTIERALKILQGERLVVPVKGLKVELIVPEGANGQEILAELARGVDPDFVAAEKGVVPGNVSTECADEGMAWSKPSLADFTDKAWGDLKDTEKRKIAKHFAWAAEMPPETFGDLKLPHHDPKTGKVVWNGVHGAMGALNGSRGGAAIPDGDRQKVYDHLAAHYKQFKKDPPDLKAFEVTATKALWRCQHCGGQHEFEAESGATLELASLTCPETQQSIITPADDTDRLLEHLLAVDPAAPAPAPDDLVGVLAAATPAELKDLFTESLTPLVTDASRSAMTALTGRLD